jgi:hypothetical protein
MRVKQILQSLLVHPAVRHLDIDTPAAVLRHARMIRQKPFLHRLYRDWYGFLRAGLPGRVLGAVVELGSGGGFIREVIPEAVTTDVQPTAGLCMALDATAMPFRNRSLKAILMVDVLHHLSCVSDFFQDASRCVNAGGVIAMIEPWNTAMSRLFYRNFHREPFDSDTRNWHLPGGGPMSGANQALPWILFQRDRRRFMKTFPQWNLQAIRLHTPFCYILSGGVSYRGLTPAATYAFWRALEEKLAPWMHHLGMFATITLVRKPGV